MRLFITGTDTNQGKTLVASWLCLHLGYAYFKPIQTGSIETTDSQVVAELAACRVYPETYLYRTPVSPHLAAQLENQVIDLKNITLPCQDQLIVEGAGGILVPINQEKLMIDLIRQLHLPVILVAGTQLGTINHTLLSLEALHRRHIPVLGVVLNGTPNQANASAIAYYGQTTILAEIPWVPAMNNSTLRKIPLTPAIKQIF